MGFSKGMAHVVNVPDTIRERYATGIWVKDFPISLRFLFCRIRQRIEFKINISLAHEG